MNPPPQIHGTHYWAAPITDATITNRIHRLTQAGLTQEAADLVARHPTGGPVVLAPGIIISIFPRAASTEDTAAREDHPQGHRAPAPPRTKP